MLALIEARINPGERTTERLPDLSREARELLLEAALDNNGVVMRFSTLGGVSVRTNQRSFVDEGNARLAALWRGAVDELEGFGLLEDRVGKGEVFHVTKAGYEIADRLRAA